MIFTEFRFILFFISLYVIYWFLIKKNTSRKIFLLLVSYLFYSFWDWRFLGLIILYTIINYLIGLRIEKTSSNSKRILVLGVIGNLFLLGVFKYFNFFIESTIGLIKFTGLNENIHSLKIILPVGISFYTFKAISYCIDIYKKKISHEKSVLDLALYFAFFPQIMAGPIDRAPNFIPQLKKTTRLFGSEIRSGINLFILGYIKKAIISDNIYSVIDNAFVNPGQYSFISILLAVFLYAIQIYCDFSGYSDMANGVTKLLGYKTVPNFQYPYFSPNISVFWRRWHISLYEWLKDYVYIAWLGGNRVTKLRQYFNIMVTMLLCGLWHGAGLNFIFWGGLHGVALIIHRVWSNFDLEDNFLLNLLGRYFSYVITFSFVCLSWIFFRTDSLQGALKIFLTLAGFKNAGTKIISPFWLLIALFIVFEYLYYELCRKGKFNVYRLPDWAYSVFIGALIAILILFVPIEEKPFIYFQF